LLVGPVPPPLGGASVLFRQLILELEDIPNLNVTVINTYNDALLKAPRLVSVFGRFTLVMVRVMYHLSRVDCVGIHVSKRGFNLFAPSMYILCKLFGKRIILRKFGGDLIDTYKCSSGFGKALIRTVFNSDLVLLETKAQVEYFKTQFVNANIKWYPNSRPLKFELETRKSDFMSRVVFVGHVKPSKGVREIVQAANNLELHLDIFGPISGGITEADFFGINVEYKGVLEAEDVCSILSNYDALVLPTYYEGEGYPGVILEAYSVGLPVISTHWKDIAELVEDGVSGILVKPKDALDLEEKMRALIDNPEMYRMLRVGAKKRAEVFSSITMTEIYAEWCTNSAE